FRGRYLLLVFLISFLLLLIHAAWHSVLAAFPPYGSLLEEYPIIQAIGHNLGLVSWSGIDPLMAVHLLMPEMLLTGVTAPESKSSKHQQFPILTSAGKYLCLLLIMLSGVMRPSVTSGIYFLVFMGAATAWAVGQPLGKGFAVLGRCVMAVMAVHTAGLLVYQCTYFGLTKLVILNQSEPSSFEYEVTDDHMWATLASPLVILFTYFVLAIETRELFKPKPKEKSTLTGLEAGKMSSSALVRAMSFHRGSKHLTKEKWMNATKKVRLMRNVSPSKRWLNVRSFSHLHQDSTGSVIVPDAESVISSYIATTITMMTWSIMFHSWLTFVLLMWANVVWLCQDQRSFMLKTSPVLREEEGHSRLLRAFGKGLRAACARYWIYVVVIMLFVIGVTGGRMTIFRIIYMFLFLSFILMFQISLYWWRRLMYLFWIILIGYSMLNLMLLYIYQFDNFSTIIETYLHINEKLQHSLGLEPYHPADLFVKLLTPTLFLIITIMQVHYFHKDFMALSDPKTRKASRSYAPTDRRSQSTAFKTVMLKKILVLRQEAYQWMDKMFIFLNTHLRISVLIISTLISIYVMAKMVYQIDYILHSYFDVECTKIIDANRTEIIKMNNAEWFGFTKATSKRPITVIMKGYIALIAVFTFYSLVTYRQQSMREQGLLTKDREKVMFPNVTRKEADIDMKHFLKYLMNYGFYKFGVEYNIKQVRTWLFLPYADDPPHAMKLIFDYFLLLFASRQVRVFKIEQTQGENYAGGSNSEDIGKDWETPTFVNPVPDFLGLVSSALDVLKRMVFLGMLWVTLAIMFMTGTNRVNLFSMGYLIGSFIFLWQGTDFYLRPKHVILQW
ncbi:Protein PIEZO2, partial [Operophtera brumata]